MKRIKTAEEYVESLDFQEEDGGDAGWFMWVINLDKDLLINMIRKAQLDMLEYAVNKCAENADTILDCPHCSGNYCECEREVDKQSILKTIDEIKKELDENKNT